LWLVAARSGSRSVPHKNIRLLNGIPLLAYRIKTALHFSPAAHVWCSTDSADYARIASEYGATVPFLRPAALALDTSSSTDVVLHAIAYAEENNYRFDYIALLEPTSPFVYYRDLESALQKLDAGGQATGIVAVKEARPNTIFIQDESEYLDTLAGNIKASQSLNRQNQPKQVTPSGGFYISKWEAFKQNKTFYTTTTQSYLLPDECSLEIDEEIDWHWAEFLLEKQLIDIQRIF